MPAYSDFCITKKNDSTLTIPLSPPVPIGGWEVEFQLNQNFPLPPKSSGLIVKSMASGFYGVSGMNIVNSGQGSFRVSIPSVDTSGLCAGNYAYAIRRTNSGFYTTLTEGYASLGNG